MVLFKTVNIHLFDSSPLEEMILVALINMNHLSDYNLQLLLAS